MSEPATPPGMEPVGGELQAVGNMTAEQPVPEPPPVADLPAGNPTTDHAMPLLEPPHPVSSGHVLTPAAAPVPSGSSHTPAKLLAQPQSSKRPASQPLNLIPKRRSSSRSIKRKKFDDELVESSLAKTSRMKGAPPTPMAPGGAVGVEPGRPLVPSVEQLAPEKKKSSSSKRVKKSKQLVQVAKDLGRWKPSDDLLLINGVLQDYDYESDEESSSSSEEDDSEAQENCGRPPRVDGVSDDSNSSASDSGDSSSSDSEESPEGESHSLKRNMEAARWNEILRILHVMHFRQERLITKINSLQKQLKKLKKKRTRGPEPLYRPYQWPFVIPRKRKKHGYNERRNYVERQFPACHLSAVHSTSGRNVPPRAAYPRQHTPLAGAPGRAASFETAANEDEHAGAAVAMGPDEMGFTQTNSATSPIRPDVPSSHCHAEEPLRPALGGLGIRVKSENLQECPHTIDQNGQIVQAQAMTHSRPASVGSGEVLVIPGHSPLSDGYRARDDPVPHFADVSPDSQLGHAGVQGGGHHSYSSGSPSPVSPQFLPTSGTPQIMEIYSGLEPAAMAGGGQPKSPYLSEYQMSFPMRSPSKVGFRVANYSGSLVYIGGADSSLTVSKCALEQCLSSAPDPRKFLGKLADKTNDLAAVHMGVKFSCRFTQREVQERWYALLYDPVVSKLACQSMRELHPDAIVAVQSRALFSKDEERILAKVASTSQPSLETFQDVFGKNPHVWHPCRTAKALQMHWQLLKQFHLLEDQTVQQLPKGDQVLNFSDAEDTIDDSELRDVRDETLEHELAVADRRQKREIRQLEQELPKWQAMVDSVTGLSPPEFDNQTLAVLRGRLVRYLMRSREITLGRATKDNQIDVDLSLEGPSWKISRKQGTIKLKSNGDFFIANEGRRPIFIDGRPVLSGAKWKLNNNSVVEISGLRFVFLINQDLIALIRAETAKMAQQ
ncbi:microspherule protein 1 isoform X1 [Lampetra planeri]